MRTFFNMPFGFLTFLCISFSLNSLQAQELRVEPPNWWYGMQETKLQLLVQGDNIGSSSVEIIDQQKLGVQLVEQHQADSPNYLFLDLDLSKVKKAGSIELRFNGKGTQFPLSAEYRIGDRNQDPESLVGFNSSDLVYLLTPDRFSNGDTSNDIIPEMREKKLGSKQGDRRGGDIQGIINHLDYLQDLGVTAIWTNPLLENDMPEYSYHGYSITDYYKVDRRFGDLALYKQMADELRARDMKLIFDGIVNHCGLHHWWMSDLPFEDWVHHSAENYVETNHKRSTHWDPYASQADHDVMEKGWFVGTMPDLNQRNPYFANYLIQNSIWWIETLGLSGIRQDTYPYPYPEFLSAWTCRIMDEYPNFNIVGEEWSYNPLLVSYWQAGKVEDLGSCLGSVMDFPNQQNLLDALTEEGDYWNSSFVKLYEGLANDFVYSDPQKLMIFMDNHDMDRVYTYLGQSSVHVKMALTYIATMRGIPQMFYGTEVLADHTGLGHDHGVIRYNFPGGFPGDKSSAKENKGLTPDQADMLQYTKTLFNWRKNNPIIHTGKLMHFAPKGNTLDYYVYFRYTAEKKIMVVLNKGEAIALDLSAYKEVLNGHRAYRKALNDEDWSIAPSSITIPKGASIFEFK